MAEEDVSVSSAAAPEESLVPQLSDHEKKRKLGDLETEAPELLSGVDSLRNHDGEGEVENADQEEKVEDESELKRPRLEDNGEQPALVAENGHKVENIGENPAKVEENNNLEDGDEKPSAEDEQTQEAPVPVEEPPAGQLQNDAAEDEKPKTGSADETEESKGEVEEPSAAGEESGNQPESGSDGATTSKKMEVPNNKVGVLIGKAGDTIRFLQYNSGAKIQIMRDADADPRAATRPVELIGTLESINKAEKLINDVIAEADAGGSPSLVARGFSTVQAVVGDQVEIQVPNEKVGLIIGKGGETIKNLQTRSGARIQLVPQHLPAGDQSKERTVRVTGDRKQIEMAREMIKEVMTQPMRPSPLSGAGYHQPAFRPRGPVAPQWANCGHPGPYMGGYDYQQRGPYPSQSSQYPAPQYGNYSQQAPRSSYGPSWEQRPPAAMHGQPPQANYNYGQPQGPEYGQPAPYSQAPAPSYGLGYNEMKYDNQLPSQHPYGGHGMPQSTGGYPQGTAAHPGYGPQDQYGRPGSYGVPPQGPHSQSYGQQPRAHQPGEMPYGGPPSTQAYGSNAPPQQTYGYSGAVQQSYPPYGSGHAADGYSHPPPTAAGPGYPQPAGQAVSGYGQPGGQQQQPSAYASVGGYSSYPSQPGYAEQAPAANTGYGYQGTAEAAYPGSAAYGAAQQGYAQPPPTQAGYDQTNTQAGAYGTAPAPAPAPAPAAAPAPAPTSAAAAAPAGYGKSVSPQPGYPQYDASQMYAAPR